MNLEDAKRVMMAAVQVSEDAPRLLTSWVV